MVCRLRNEPTRIAGVMACAILGEIENLASRSTSRAHARWIAARAT